MEASLMTLAKRTDANQKEIVKDLRKLGYSVAVTSGAGDGFPDLVIGKNGVNWLIEIKDCNKPPSQQKLTPPQVKFHSSWTGQIGVATTTEEVLKIIEINNRKSVDINI